MFNNSYTAVHKIKHATKMESGLFRFLSQTKYHTVQDYILINLACKNNLYDILNMDGYVISNRHIRIDRFFVKPNTLLPKQKLLSHWHYTEEYRHADKPPLKLHVYFNHALFLLACIHQKDGSFLEITNKSALAKIRMNTYEAEQIVNGFLKELTSYRMHLEAEFNALLGRFELENVNDLTKKEFVTYIDLCKQKSAELSSYMEDRIDKRAYLLEESLKKLRADYKSLMRETRNIAQASIDSSFSQKGNAIVKTEQPSALLPKQTPIAQILKNAKLFIEKYNAKHNAKQLLELMAEKELTLGELLQNWQEGNSRHGATFRLYIEQIHNLPSICTKILDLALEGRVSDIKFLYNNERTHPYMQLKFFYQFLTLCYMSKNSEAIVELCLFFYEHAPEYREYLSIFPHLPMKKDFEYVGLSSLVRMAQQNNFVLFKLLIEQLNTPHIVGACFDNKCMPLIHYLLADDYEMKYIQLLLDASIVAEYPGFASFHAWFSNLIKSRVGEHEDNKQPTKIPPMSMQELACYDSAFVVGCHRLLRDNSILPLLLNISKQANAINLLLGISSFIKSISYKIDFIQTKGALKVVNLQEFYAKEQAVTKTDEDFAWYMQITFANEFLLQSNFVSQILEIVRDNVLKENVTDDELYEKCVRQLLTFAMEQERVKSINVRVQQNAHFNYA